MQRIQKRAVIQQFRGDVQDIRLCGGRDGLFDGALDHGMDDKMGFWDLDVLVADAAMRARVWRISFFVTGIPMRVSVLPAGTGTNESFKPGLDATVY